MELVCLMAELARLVSTSTTVSHCIVCFAFTNFYINIPVCTADCTTTTAVKYSDTSCNVATETTALGSLTFCQRNSSRANSFAWSANLNCVLGSTVPVVTDSVLYSYRASTTNVCSQQVQAVEIVSTEVCLKATNRGQSYNMDCSSTGSSYSLSTYIDNTRCAVLTYNSQVVNLYTPTCPAVGYPTSRRLAEEEIVENVGEKEGEAEALTPEVDTVDEIEEVQEEEDTSLNDLPEFFGFEEVSDFAKGIEVEQMGSGVAVGAVNTWWVTFNSYTASNSYYATSVSNLLVFILCDATNCFFSLFRAM